MRSWIALISLLLCLSPVVAAQPEPDRPADQLLTQPALQTVVEAQIDRDGDALIEALGAERPAVRARAAFALASVQDSAAVPALFARLDDGVPLVRTDAAFALGHMPAAAVSGAKLLSTLRQERDVTMQRYLIDALGKTGDAKTLIGLLEIGLPAARDADVALALARFGMRGVVDSVASAWLIERLRSTDDWARRNAAYALGRVPALADGHADSIRQALDEYTKSDPAAMHLLRALGRLNAQADVDRLATWLASAPDWRTRVNAARALVENVDTADATQTLVRALKDPHPLVARTAAETLAETPWTAETRTAVGVWISSHPDRWRVVAPLVRGLAANGRSGQALKTVRDWRSNRPSVQYAAIVPALAHVDTARADTLLFQALQADDPRVSAAAMQTLVEQWERVRPSRAPLYFEQFSAALRRGDPAVLYHGASVLADSVFIARGGADTLAATYRSLTAPADLEGMTAVLEALATIGDSTARSILHPALDHTNHAIRAAAAEGLSRIEDTTITAPRTPLPETPPVDWAYLQTLGPHPHLMLETTRGKITIELDTEQAPQTVQAISRLAEAGRYDGVPFHRVVPNFVIQGGDFARRDGFGGADFLLRTEITRLRHRRGTIGMASAGKDTESSQFFVPHSMQPHLDSGYTSFGQVISGMDVVDRIRAYDTISEATIQPDDDS